METEILDVDYNDYVTILGTAHFTRRSFVEANAAVTKLKPTDLAIELDIRRFQFLNLRCSGCLYSTSCTGMCEFMGATDALGNVDANIWLIDMSESEIMGRVQKNMGSYPWWFSFISFPSWSHVDNEVQLWENGYKDEVLKKHSRRLELLRKRAPHVWRVLIDERNVLMAARLAWIATKRLNMKKNVNILALTGAAHVKGIKELLNSPRKISEEMRRFGLRFTVPKLIRRVNVN